MLDLQNPGTLNQRMQEIFGTKPRRWYEPHTRKSHVSAV